MERLSSKQAHELSYLFAKLPVGVYKVDNQKPAVDPSKKQDGHVCIVLEPGDRYLDVGYYQTAIIGSDTYNRSSIKYNFKAGKSYRLFAILPDKKTINYKIEQIE